MYYLVRKWWLSLKWIKSKKTVQRTKGSISRLRVKFPKVIAQVRETNHEKHLWVFDMTGSCHQLLDTAARYKSAWGIPGEKDALQRQDSRHSVGRSSATHFYTANADIQEYSVIKSKIINSLKKLVSFFIQINWEKM